MNPTRDAWIIKGRVAPHEIGYLNSQLDACEGLAVVRSIAPKEGRVVFWVSPSCLSEFYRFIEAIQKEMPIELEPHTGPLDSP
ncbi:MAG TPA: DUF4911 domain-containing protein [bacterium]|jgi:hypothetical protein|nr:DUF4911 domain-containing protein [bacterium]HQL63149.1 DUF4911 domain-containing protein [bacterium]